MTTYRCADPACQHGIIWQRIGVCPRCGNRLEPVPPKRLARPATPALDQLAREETRPDGVQAGQDKDALQDQREMEVEDVRGGSDGGEQLHGPPRLPVPRVRPLARDQQTVDQLAINEELESFDEWVRGLSAEGGQAR